MITYSDSVQKKKSKETSNNKKIHSYIFPLTGSYKDPRIPQLSYLMSF